MAGKKHEPLPPVKKKRPPIMPKVYSVTAKVTQGVIILVLLFLLGNLPGTHVYQAISPKTQQAPLAFLPFEMPSPLSYPVRTTAVEPPPVSAKAVQITDELTSEVLYAKNPNTPLPPASLTKLMTALISLDYCDPQKVIPATFTPLQYDESRMGLKPGDTITVESALYGLLLPSGNDAAEVLARNCTPQVTSYTALTKAKSVLLGLSQTNLTNPAGQDAQGNVTTAHDMTLVALAAIKHPVITTIAKTPYKLVSDTTGLRRYPLFSTNLLLTRNVGVIGLKTGTTDNAGQNFIALANSANTADRKIVLVLLGSSDRFSETVQLLSWVRQNVAWKLPAPIPDYRPDFAR